MLDPVDFSKHYEMDFRILPSSLKQLYAVFYIIIGIALICICCAFIIEVFRVEMAVEIKREHFARRAIFFV